MHPNTSRSGGFAPNTAGERSCAAASASRPVKAAKILTSSVFTSYEYLLQCGEIHGRHHIAFLLQYINGKIDDTSDDIIRDSVLYDYICRILETLTRKDVATKASITEVIRDQISDYKEAMAGARDRLANALEIIVTAYYAALIKRNSDEMLANLMSSY